MINTQLERIVTLVMDAYTDVHGDEYDVTPIFELEVRKALMQEYCNTKNYTYTITPGEGVMGKWTTKECPPNVDYTAKQILNG